MELGGIQFLPTATSRSVQYHQSVAETDLSFACTEEPPTEITIILPFLQSKIMSWGKKSEMLLKPSSMNYLWAHVQIWLTARQARALRHNVNLHWHLVYKPQTDRILVGVIKYHSKKGITWRLSFFLLHINALMHFYNTCLISSITTKGIFIPC